MSATELPPLPEPVTMGVVQDSVMRSYPCRGFTAEQMTAYALQCIAEGCTPTDIRVLRQANVDLAAESERNRVDAERYRWLRDVGDATWRPFGLREGCSATLADAAIDSAINAALAAKDFP